MKTTIFRDLGIYGLSMTIILYFVIAFHQLNFNPLTWCENARVIFSVPLAIVIFITIVFLVSYIDKQQKNN